MKKPKKQLAPKKSRAWFESKVAALKTALEKLPPDRQAQLEQDLQQEKKP